nr:odorant binding protein [Semanotus bifasciatus]
MVVNVEYIFILTCLLVVVLAQFSSEEVQNLLQYHEECKLKTNIDDYRVLNILTGTFPDDPLLRRHVFCLSKKFGIQNEAGEIQRREVREKLEKLVNNSEKIDEIIKTCIVQKDDPEQTAVDIARCYIETIVVKS